MQLGILAILTLKLVNNIIGLNQRKIMKYYIRRKKYIQPLSIKYSMYSFYLAIRSY